MENPFVFGRIVDKSNFCNRKREIKELRSNIENGFSLWLFAPRRYGKSSLIKQAINILSKDIKVVYFDLYNIKSTDDFVRRYSNALTKELFSWKDDVKKITKQLGKYLKSLQPQVSFDTTASPSLLLSNKELSEQVDIEAILNLPEKIAKEQNCKVCIAFDEFQEISRIDSFLINWMRSTFQNQKYVSYVFLGSKQSLMHDIFSKINSPFYEYAVKMNIGTISRKDLFNFIEKKFSNQKLKISTKTIDSILDTSKCHPHFTQYFASVVFDEIRNGLNENDDNFRNIWVNKIIDSQSVIFQNIYDQLNNNQRKVLITLTNSPTDVFSNITKEKFNLPSSSTLATNLNGLISKDLIFKDKNAYYISNPVFEIWLKTLN